jgi:hypothetical protein
VNNPDSLWKTVLTFRVAAPILRRKSLERVNKVERSYAEREATHWLNQLLRTIQRF